MIFIFNLHKLSKIQGFILLSLLLRITVDLRQYIFTSINIFKFRNYHSVVSVLS